MKVPILQVSLCSTVEWFATFALLRFKEYLHQFRFAQLANKALSNTYFAILALLELCKIICFPSLCSGTKYISTARSARCANKVSFWFNFYGLANFVYMLPFTTRWIKKYILISGKTEWLDFINRFKWPYLSPTTYIDWARTRNMVEYKPRGLNDNSRKDK